MAADSAGALIMWIVLGACTGAAMFSVWLAATVWAERQDQISRRNGNTRPGVSGGRPALPLSRPPQSRGESAVTVRPAVDTTAPPLPTSISKAEWAARLGAGGAVWL